MTWEECPPSGSRFLVNYLARSRPGDAVPGRAPSVRRCPATGALVAVVGRSALLLGGVLGTAVQERALHNQTLPPARPRCPPLSAELRGRYPRPRRQAALLQLPARTPPGLKLLLRGALPKALPGRGDGHSSNLAPSGPPKGSGVCQDHPLLCGRRRARRRQAETPPCRKRAPSLLLLLKPSRSHRRIHPSRQAGLRGTSTFQQGDDQEGNAPQRGIAQIGRGMRPLSRYRVPGTAAFAVSDTTLSFWLSPSI